MLAYLPALLSTCTELLGSNSQALRQPAIDALVGICPWAVSSANVAAFVNLVGHALQVTVSPCWTPL